jgi:hypothetical protein
MKFKNFLCGFGLLAQLCPLLAVAQDLNQESTPEAKIEWQRRDGHGAQIDSCELIKNKSLKCHTDRLLAKVECETRDFVGPNQSQKLLPAKIFDESFMCSLSSETIYPSQSLQIYLLGSDGKFTEYSVRFSSQENMEKIYLRESSFVSERGNSYFHDPSVLVKYSALSGDYATQFYGVESRVYLGPQTFGVLDWRTPVGDSAVFGSGFSLGLNWMLLSRLSVGLGAFFEEQEQRRLQGPELVVGLRQNLGFEKLNLLSEFKLRYPNVEKLRQAMRVKAVISLGPYMRHRLSLEAGAGYINELWTSDAGTPWELKTLTYQAGVRWNFDTRK